jgi:Uncharacterised nucleotidyltransferase
VSPPANTVDALHRILHGVLAALPDRPDRLAARDLAIDATASRHDPSMWEDFVVLAGHHGVLGVIDAALPQSARELAKRRLAIDELWQSHLTQSLQTAVAALAEVGVDACALKGPVLAARLYPTPVSRSCLDIDLLVRPEDCDRAVRALERVGYRAPMRESARYLRRYSHHVGLSHAGLAPLELHFRAYEGFGVTLPSRVLLGRAKPFPLSATQSVLVPSPEDELLYLAVHAAGHSFIRLVWLFDLKLLVRRYPAIDWDRVARDADELGVATAVGYALRLLRDWLGVSIEPLPARLARRGVRTAVADCMLHEVSRPQPRSATDTLGGLLFTSLLCDQVSSGAWLVQHHLLRVTRRRFHAIAPAYLPARWSA